MKLLLLCWRVRDRLGKSIYFCRYLVWKRKKRRDDDDDDESREVTQMMKTRAKMKTKMETDGSRGETNRTSDEVL